MFPPGAAPSPAPAGRGPGAAHRPFVQLDTVAGPLFWPHVRVPLTPDELTVTLPAYAAQAAVRHVREARWLARPHLLGHVALVDVTGTKTALGEAVMRLRDKNPYRLGRGELVLLHTLERAFALDARRAG